MSFFAGVLTFFLVIICLLLILLILVQLPKKDAGAGLAFGGGAADALFGAGSGNVLTKITKWTALVFFVMALFLGYLEDRIHSGSSTSSFEKNLQQKQSEAPMSVPPSQAPVPAQPTMPSATPPSAVPQNNQPSTPPPASSNAPSAPTQSP